MARYVREMTAEEKDTLMGWTSSGEDKVLEQHARMILLSSSGYQVGEIATVVKVHPRAIRTVIETFNEEGITGLLGAAHSQSTNETHLYARKLTAEEKDTLMDWKSSGEDKVLERRAKMILLSSSGHQIGEIAPIVKVHPRNIRIVIGVFNKKGVPGLREL